MTKHQVAVVAVSILVACLAIAAIPFLQQRAANADRERGAKAGLMLLHKFDCTIGIPFRNLLADSAYASSIAAANNFEQARHQSGAQKQSTLRTAQTQQLRAADLLRQFGEVQPLTPGNIPCPSK